MEGDHVLQNVSVKPYKIPAISASLNINDSLGINKIMNARVRKHFDFLYMAIGPDGLRLIETVIAIQYVVSV